MMISPVAVLLVITAPAAGSFLAVLADRLPRGEDVIRHPSACRACGNRLVWRDLIPLVSYLALRGQCRHCAAPIPGFVPLSEVAATILAIAVVMLAQSPGEMLLGALWLWVLLGLLLADLLWTRLPDVLSAALLVTGLALAWEDPGRSLLEAGITALAASAAFWAIRFGYQRLRGREGLGLGDVKLVAGLGAGLGAELLPVTVLIAALGGLGVALFQAGRAGRMPRADSALPFGAYLAGAAIVVWLGSRAGL